jgi:AcrR family transcriptional regulator
VRSDSQRTQAKLIAVAEGLFAERGIEGVSLSEINRAAEQGNNSALHYHFGSKDGLIAAIWEKHAERLSEPVAKSLADMPSAPSPRDVVAHMVHPLSTRLDDPEGGASFLRIMAQAHANPTEHLFKSVVHDTPQGWEPFEELLRGAAPSMPDGARRRRIELLSSSIFLGLSDIARRESRDPRAAEHRDQYIEELIASLTGLLTAAP